MHSYKWSFKDLTARWEDGIEEFSRMTGQTLILMSKCTVDIIADGELVFTRFMDWKFLRDMEERTALRKMERINAVLFESEADETRADETTVYDAVYRSEG
ncbi:hypothetical protein GCK32_005615 [Trichostrongylus colubriformis]|uniref:Uncharacterized protein n=1 Tax=Trichostrongylus colubriformis TaxID=6319 RepID=A0AAN8GF02_TRICO